jgi:hypothetical protein
MRHPLRNLFLLLLGRRVYKHYKNRKMIDSGQGGRPYGPARKNAVAPDDRELPR